ncbi:hypothetical protein DFH06DRAFT_661467 [Mycena polygramma]|nr:hypothetical protein DFH06DRAFT_661467 [Mycena polygramma]
MHALWSVLVPALVAAAGPTNHTIDDGSPLVTYLPSGRSGMACAGCSGATDLQAWQLNSSMLENGTFSGFDPNLSEDTGLRFNFTGTGVYIFLVAMEMDTLSPLPPENIEFFLDDVLVGSTSNFPNEARPLYNVSVYGNGSIPDGPHRFQMTVPSLLIFHYAVYTYIETPLGPKRAS